MAWEVHPSDLREHLTGESFQNVSQDTLVTFSMHKLPFKILVQKLFVICINPKFLPLLQTNVMWGLKSQQVIQG